MERLKKNLCSTRYFEITRQRSNAINLILGLMQSDRILPYTHGIMNIGKGNKENTIAKKYDASIT